jgi:hypothetical protein
MSKALLLGVCVGLHVLTIALLAIRRSQLPTAQWPSSQEKQRTPLSARWINCVGCLTAFLTLTIPYAVKTSDSLTNCGIRVTCFFYACKLLDLACGRAEFPPVQHASAQGQASGSRPVDLRTLKDRITYVWLLLTQMRYRSFDIHVTQRDRPGSSEKGFAFDPWEWFPIVLVPMTTYFFPIPETQCATVLLLIQLSLECLHLMLHPFCPTRLFYKPFAATSISSFWTTHWHAAASPFLRTLAYNPGKRIAGRWLGVLFTFGLSGIWHGWAAAVLVDSDHALELASKVFMFFVLVGVGCLGEQWIWAANQGQIVQRVIVWIYVLSLAGWCFRTLRCYTSISSLRIDGCIR